MCCFNINFCLKEKFCFFFKLNSIRLVFSYFYYNYRGAWKEPSYIVFLLMLPVRVAHSASWHSRLRSRIQFPVPANDTSHVSAVSDTPVRVTYPTSNWSIKNTILYNLKQRPSELKNYRIVLASIVLITLAETYMCPGASIVLENNIVLEGTKMPIQLHGRFYSIISRVSWGYTYMRIHSKWPVKILFDYMYNK